MIAGFQHGHDRVDRRHPAGENPRRHATFERSKILLEPRPRGIRHPRIFIPLVLADPLLHISRRRINRHRHRTRQRIRLLPRVNRLSRKTKLLLFFHL